MTAALNIVYGVVILGLILMIVMPNLSSSARKTMATVFLTIPATLTVFAFASVVSQTLSKKS